MAESPVSVEKVISKLPLSWPEGKSPSPGCPEENLELVL